MLRWIWMLTRRDGLRGAVEHIHALASKTIGRAGPCLDALGRFDAREMRAAPDAHSLAGGFDGSAKLIAQLRLAGEDHPARDVRDRMNEQHQRGAPATRRARRIGVLGEGEDLHRDVWGSRCRRSRRRLHCRQISRAGSAERSRRAPSVSTVPVTMPPIAATRGVIAARAAHAERVRRLAQVCGT